MERSAFYEMLYDIIGNVRVDSLSVLQTLKSEGELHALDIHSLGLDSVEMFEMIGYIEEQYSIKIPDAQIFSFKTVGEIKQAVEGNGCY
ncbi:TPA: phosphopantetheine-binding protein [Serratia marcescens]|uniref:phosphopantetheine-binding protein n=1 Tax=Serratia TaxID=613 RepID=UPI002DBF7A1F|nr:phosphopantetheine-binding protein [Serratia marcescens]MEB7509790.1 acyl carrier protein [Serratia marcescens]